MIVRFDSVSAAPRAKRAQGRRAIRATVAAASFLFCGLAAAQGGASAAQAGAASAASAAAAPVSTAGQYTVHPGQSLHDVAVDLTQSHDKATLARMSQAIFDANPNAFIKQDPSRMRVGATLNVPATPDLSSAAAGMTAASGGAAAAAAAASAPATAPTASAVSASTPAAASSAAAQAEAAASSAAAVATAGASSASAAATAATASAVPASGPEAAAQGASGAAAVGASAAALASAASDSHVWSGSIQSAPASGAAGASEHGAKGTVMVSSLQQLLALKNRVLMALQQHGIGKPAQTAGGASAGAPAAQAGAPVQNGAANAGAAAGQPEVSPIAMGAVAAVVVALLALFVRLLMRKRKKPAEQAPDVSPEAAHEPTPSASAAAVAAAPVAEEPPVLREPISHAGGEPDAHEIAPAAEAEFVPPVAPKADEVVITPVPTPAVSSEPLEHDATAAHAAGAGVDTTAGLGAEALPPTLTETLHPATPQAPSVAQEAQATADLPHDVEAGEPQTLADATDAASLAAAAELGADALPPESLGAPRTAEDAEALARTHEDPARVQKPATPDMALNFGDGEPQAVQAQQAAQTPPITEAFERPPAPLTAPEIPSVPAVTAEDMSYAEVPIAFPHDAIEALGGLDLPLPPRIGEPVMPTAPLSTEPAATPEASARLSSPFFEPPPPLAGEAIEAGTAGAGALAGLGAPRFGALTLDFDLNLPPDSAEPLPVFTPEQLARIARNKLDLAHEYIALGDVSGARSLINEVIESNDPATRSDAQALLSTLAPLS
ncbi:FimV/HubP family polar landmark protein [Paraburkholderia sp. JHI869]|uniref:FimV/HubP family polar landmark protein n=1 Tax=Paraburkholderia sp. JHI869 TaxID=3112959 RepID=UPI00316DA87C